MHNTHTHTTLSTHAEFLSTLNAYTFTAKTIIILGKNIKMKSKEQNNAEEEEEEKTVTTLTKII